LPKTELHNAILQLVNVSTERYILNICT